ncbi:MAG: hypothetical protein ACTSXQ_02995 [Alphaproteobacteria bacterium]
MNPLQKHFLLFLNALKRPLFIGILAAFFYIFVGQSAAEAGNWDNPRLRYQKTSQYYRTPKTSPRPNPYGVSLYGRVKPRTQTRDTRKRYHTQRNINRMGYRVNAVYAPIKRRRPVGAPYTISRRKLCWWW